jgi:hypothetical protein
MEINYNTIIKILTKKQNFKIENIVSTNENILQDFMHILSNNFYKIDVLQTYNKKNISFYTSFLTLLYEDFKLLSETEQYYKINSFFSELSFKYLSNYLKSITTDTLKKYVKDLESNIWVLELIANNLKINMLIFDKKTKNIYTIYANEIMDPWRPFLLFLEDTYFYPICTNENKIFSYNDPVIKKILNSKPSYYKQDIINKEFILVDNLKEIINSNHIVKSLTEPVAKSVTKPFAKSVTKPFAKSVTKSLAEPVVEPVTKSLAEPVVEPVTKSLAEPVTKSLAEPVTKSLAEPVTKSLAEPVTKSLAEPVTKSLAKPVVEPVTKSLAEPVAKSLAEPVTKSLAEPVTKSLAEPVTKSLAKPVTKSLAKPVVEPVAKSLAKPVVDLKKLSENKLNKMIKQDILNYMAVLKLDINSKLTKKELIKIILE